MSYKVKLDVFEGPFDLLVYLIENAEMSIYDIRVSEITNQYLEYIEGMQKQDVIVAGEFMVLAAALIELKSKMLLPQFKAEGLLDTEEDPRDELVQRLLEYKRFKVASEFFEKQEERMQAVFSKPQEDLVPYTLEPDEYLNLDIGQFMKAFHLFLNKKKKLEDIKKRYTRVERQRMSIEARIEQIKNFFMRKPKSTFSELLDGKSSRYHVVLTFVSMLELLKQRAITVQQSVNYGEITLALCQEHGQTKIEEGSDSDDQ